LTDLTASQAQPSAECACPRRPTIVVDADQRRRVVGPNGHPQVYDGAAMPLIGDASSATAPQAGHDAFPHGSAVATRGGAVHLTRGPYARPAALAQEPQDVLRGGRRGAGRDRFRDPDGKKPRWVQGRPPGGSIERQIASQRVAGWSGGRRAPTDRLRHVVAHGLHVAGVTGVSPGHRPAPEEARRWRGTHAGLATNLGGAVALPLAHGRDGRSVGVDQLAVGQGLALRAPAGLLGKPVMRLERGGERGIQACPRLLRPPRGPRHTLLGGPCQGQDVRAQGQQWRLRLAHQRHTPWSPPPTRSAEAAQQFLAVVREVLRLRLHRRGLGGALRR